MEIKNLKVRVILLEKYEKGPFRDALKVEDVDNDYFDKVENNFTDENGNYKKTMLLDFYEFINIASEIEDKQNSNISSELEEVRNQYLFLDSKCNNLEYRQFLAEEPIRRNSKILEVILREPILNDVPSVEKIEKIIGTQGKKKFIKANKDKIDLIIKEMKAVESKKEANEKEYENDLKAKEKLKKLLDTKRTEMEYQNNRCNCLGQFCSYIVSYIKGYIRNGEVLIYGTQKVNPEYLNKFALYIDNYIKYNLKNNNSQQYNDDSLVIFQNHIIEYQEKLKSKNVNAEEELDTEFKTFTKMSSSKMFSHTNW